MTKKSIKKRRIVSAIAAVITAALALVAPFSSFAVELPMPNAYNFNNLTNANMAQTPNGLHADFNSYGIVFSNRDAFTGSFSFSNTQLNTANRSVILSQTLRELAPYLKAGDTIVVSWDTSVQGTYTNQLQILTGATFGAFVTSGTPITVTQQLLNSYFVFYPIPANSPVGTLNTYSNFRINLNEQMPFEPYSATENYVQYLNNIYESAYNNGVADGVNSVHPSNAIFTAQNLQELMVSFRNDTDTDMIIQDSTSEDNDRYTALVNSSAFDGYTVNTALFPKTVLQSPSSDLFPDAIGLFFVFDAVKAGNLELSVTIPEQTQIIVNLFTEVGENYVARKGFSNDTTVDQSYTFSNAVFGLAEDTEIVALYVEYTVKLYYPNLAPPASYRDYFPDAIITTRTKEYADGYYYGQVNGYNNGYQEGNKNGIQTGYGEGYADGAKTGQTQGFNKGYQEGQKVGYTDGFEEGSSGTLFYNFFGAVVDAPVTMLMNLLDFNIFGINMSAFFAGLITILTFLAIVFFVLRMII